MVHREIEKLSPNVLTTFKQKTDFTPNVCFWHKTDIQEYISN